MTEGLGVEDAVVDGLGVNDAVIDGLGVEDAVADGDGVGPPPPQALPFSVKAVGFAFTPL